jgi:transcription factor SPN1
MLSESKCILDLIWDQDLEEAFDDEIAALKIRMEQACEADNNARVNGQPAIHKLKMLPEVVALLNRNTVQHSIVDPDTNFLQSVKFFLEPLNDGSLPAYNIQRDLFAALVRLPIEKEALLSSGIGKVVLYYTKSKKPEIGIKRIAERLLGEWSRPILKRSDDYKKRKVATREFDYQYVLNFFNMNRRLIMPQCCTTRTPSIRHPVLPNSFPARRPHVA